MTNSEKLSLALKSLKQCEEGLNYATNALKYQYQGAIATIASVQADLITAEIAKKKAEIKEAKLPPVKE